MRGFVLALGLVLALSVVPGLVHAESASPCCATGDSSVHPDIEGRACNQLGSDDGAPGCLELDDGNCIGGGPALDDPMEQFVFGFCVCLEGECFSDGGSGDLKEATPRECTRDALWGCNQSLGATHEAD